MRPRFTRIGINNFRLAISPGEFLGDLLDQCDFCTGGTVEVAPQTGEGAYDGGVGVAFDGVKGYDAGECGSPSC